MTRMQALWQVLLGVVGKVLVGVSWFITRVFGVFEWHPPAWAAWIGQSIAEFWRQTARFVAEDRKRAGAALLALVALIGGYAWYRSRPKPHYVEFSVTAPALTEYDEKGIKTISPLDIQFNESAAPLKQVEKKVATGVSLTPSFAGTWFWVSDKELRFTPKSDWPVDATFTVHFDKKGFFAGGVLLEDYTADFKSQPFSAKLVSSQFYQDPRDPNLKKLVANVSFSHPVDTDQFEKRVSLAVAKDAEYLGLKPDSRHYTVVYDKFKLAAYIHSAALGMPRDDTPMTVHIDRGIRAARGGNETKERLESVVTIPGRSSLRFSGAQMTLVDNARYEPEQLLLLTSSSPVAEKDLRGKVTLWMLPVRHPQQKPEDKEPHQWDDYRQVGNDILAKSQRLNITYVPSDALGDINHGFKFLAPVGRYLYVTVPENIQGIGGYISGKPYAATILVQPYKQALTFL